MVLCKPPVEFNEKPALKKRRRAKVSGSGYKKDASHYARRAENTAAAQRNCDFKKLRCMLKNAQANPKAATMDPMFPQQTTRGDISSPSPNPRALRALRATCYALRPPHVPLP